MSLVTADKLAAALGLEITFTIQNLPRPRPRGRRPKSGTRMVNSIRQTIIWAEMAAVFARDAHENHMESRRGVWPVEGHDVLCSYNNPYANDPNRREEELAEFRRRMAEEGIEELAFATYPPEGQEDSGYTYAQIINAGEEKTDWVVDTMQSILRGSRAKPDRPSPSLRLFSGHPTEPNGSGRSARDEQV